MTARSVLVLGGADVGSAVAHRLFRLGWKVLISERERSPHARRGMAFTDALFDGQASLAGVTARLEPDLQAVESCWQRGDAVPVVTLPEAAILAALRFDVAIDTTMRRHLVPPDLRAFAPLVIGLGPGYVPGQNCHLAVETQWGETMGSVLRDHGPALRAGGPQPLGGVARERFAISPHAGVWITACQLGQSVGEGEELGRVGGHVVRAPIAGHLRGLTHDGVEVISGRRIAEVDPRPDPHIFGLGERPAAIADGVVNALNSPALSVGSS